MRRVVVTGLGCVSPLGVGVAASWDALLAGRSGIGPITRFDTSNLPVRIAGEVPDFDPVALLGGRAARHLDRFAQLAVVAAREAVEQSGLDPAAAPYRVGTVVGTGLGGVSTYDRGHGVLAARGPARVSPYLMAAMIPNAAAAQVAIATGASGPSLAPTSACASGTDAIGLAADLVRSGRVDAALAGGAEAPLTPTVLAGFATMRAVSLRADDPAGASRPFCRGRDGFVAAEGAAVLVLEERERAIARGAPLLAEIVGYGAASDAFHPTAPRPDGAGAVAALRAALADAAVAAEEVDYLNAHATSTREGDAAEARALQSVFGVRPLPVGATKSMTGHLLGASGALEAVCCVQTLRTGLVPPTINAGEPDFPLDLVADGPRRIEVRTAMSASFGFGGHDACLVLHRA